MDSVHPVAHSSCRLRTWPPRRFASPSAAAHNLRRDPRAWRVALATTTSIGLIVGLALGGVVSASLGHWLAPPRATASSASAGLNHASARTAISSLHDDIAAWVRADDIGDAAMVDAATAQLLRDADEVERFLPPYATMVTQPAGPTVARYLQAAVAAIRAGASQGDRAMLERAVWYLNAATRPSLPVIRGERTM